MDALASHDPVLSLQRSVRLWRAATLAQWFVLCLLIAATFASPSILAKSNSGVLHARGLVIEDEAGRSRILLGSPFPQTKDRLRQDATSESMIFLDAVGHDRLTLGEEPNPQIGGKVPTGGGRIAPGFGMLVHDDMGNERGGFGWLGNGRVSLALDRPDGDAIGLLVDDHHDFAGMLLLYPHQLGSASGLQLATQGGKASLQLRDLNDTTRTSFVIDHGRASFSNFDQSGMPLSALTPKDTP